MRVDVQGSDGEPIEAKRLRITIRGGETTDQGPITLTQRSSDPLDMEIDIRETDGLVEEVFVELDPVDEEETDDEDSQGLS